MKVPHAPASRISDVGIITPGFVRRDKLDLPRAVDHLLAVALTFVAARLALREHVLRLKSGATWAAPLGIP